MRRVSALPVMCSAIAVLILFVAGARGWAQKENPAAAEGGDQASGKEALLQQQLKMIDQALADLVTRYKGGEIAVTNNAFVVWRRRRLDTLRALGPGRAEYKAELNKHVEFMRMREGWVQKSYEQNVLARVDVLDAQYQRIEAELLLAAQKTP